MKKSMFALLFFCSVMTSIKMLRIPHVVDEKLYSINEQISPNNNDVLIDEF